MDTKPQVDGPISGREVHKSAHQPLPEAEWGREIARIAAAQLGLVALWQLEGLGMDRSAAAKRVAAGRLHRIHQGVYAVGHRLLPRLGPYMAAALACGPEALISHRSAASLWGLRADSRGRIDVTAPGRRGRIPVGIDAHRHGSLRAADRGEVDGVPCTSVARTLLDLAAVVTPRELRNAITQAEVRRLFDLTAVRELIGRSRRRRGVERLRQAVAAHDPRDELARKELERRFLALCRRVELPPPEVNAPLLVDSVQIEADFLWREARLIVEADSHRYHRIASAFENDRRRDQRLTVAGWRVIRCTWRRWSMGPRRSPTRSGACSPALTPAKASGLNPARGSVQPAPVPGWASVRASARGPALAPVWVSLSPFSVSVAAAAAGRRCIRRRGGSWRGGSSGAGCWSCAGRG